MKTIVKCNKNLKHSDGTISFLKGNEYSGNTCNVIENLIVTNEQGDLHKVGNWAKHFKNISTY
jgi:hypothetical protein